jgi:C4-dicarboxylate transporter DctM subunit
MVHVYVVAGKRGYPKHPRATLRQVGHAFRKAFFALLTPVIIMGGIFGGIFTPTEAAAVTAIYALGLGLFVYRDLRLSDLPRVFRNAANTSAIIGIIVACANLVSYVLTRERIPQALAEALLGVSQNPQTNLMIGVLTPPPSFGPQASCRQRDLVLDAELIVAKDVLGAQDLVTAVEETA